MASKLEYLKKYMSGDDQGEEKKKKKKKKSKHKDAGGYKIVFFSIIHIPFTRFILFHTIRKLEIFLKIQFFTSFSPNFF